MTRIIAEILASFLVTLAALVSLVGKVINVITLLIVWLAAQLAPDFTREVWDYVNNRASKDKTHGKERR